MKRQCQATKMNGATCSAAPIKNKNFCFLHDPESKQRRAEVQSIGGKNKKKVEYCTQSKSAKETYDTWHDVYEALRLSLNDLLSGKIGLREANFMCQWGQERLLLEKQVRKSPDLQMKELQAEKAAEAEIKAHYEKKYGIKHAQVILNPASRRMLIDVIDRFRFFLKLESWMKERKRPPSLLKTTS